MTDVAIHDASSVNFAFRVSPFKYLATFEAS
jgi:hypothetical protein